MTFRRNVFTSQKLSVTVAGRKFRVQALVSTQGAKYLFEDGELSPEVRAALQNEIEAIYKNIPVRCRVVKETNNAGTVYHLRFVSPSNLLLRQIERDLAESGLPSPWMRNMPRLTTEAKHLPVPSLAVLYHQQSTLFLNVRNFTLGGLLLDYVGDKLDDIRLGTRIEFDLVTNSGEKISDVSAVVTNMSIEQEESGTTRTLYGTKLLPMSVLSESKYRALIRDHCLGLREERPPPG